jgi:hypothetical protein
MRGAEKGGGATSLPSMALAWGLEEAEVVGGDEARFLSAALGLAQQVGLGLESEGDWLLPCLGVATDLIASKGGVGCELGSKIAIAAGGELSGPVSRAEEREAPPKRRRRCVAPGAAQAQAQAQLLSLSDDVLARILAYCGGWASTRAVCRTLRDVGDRNLEAARLHPETPASTLLSLLPRLGGLRALDLSKVACVEDWGVRTVVQSCPRLCGLGLAFCTKVTADVEPLLRHLVHVDVRGCWRLRRPSPLLDPFTVLEVQLLALQQNRGPDDEGLRKCFQFVGRAEREGLGGFPQYRHMVLSRLGPLVNCRSFGVHELGFDSEEQACFLVRAVSSRGGSHDYLWLLSRQVDHGVKGCWMTDAVIEAEHGLLSCLQLAD